MLYSWICELRSVALEPFDQSGICGDSVTAHSFHTRRGTANGHELHVSQNTSFQRSFKIVVLSMKRIW